MAGRTSSSDWISFPLFQDTRTTWLIEVTTPRLRLPSGVILRRRLVPLSRFALMEVGHLQEAAIGLPLCDKRHRQAQSWRRAGAEIRGVLRVRRRRHVQGATGLSAAPGSAQGVP